MPQSLSNRQRSAGSSHSQGDQSAGRVSFGSDTPFELMHVEVAKYNALLELEVTPEENQLVIGGNIARLAGLEIT